MADKHMQGKVVTTSAMLMGNGDWMLRIRKGHWLSAEVYGETEMECYANAERFTAPWNAANGMTTEEAVRYIEHGREMKEVLKYAVLPSLHWGRARKDATSSDKGGLTATINSINDILAKLEG